MLPEVKAEALRRLNYVEGHIAGIRRMLEEEKYCVDILKQTHAVRRAIQRVEALLLAGHLKSCVVEGIRDGREDQVLAELLDLYELADK